MPENFFLTFLLFVLQKAKKGFIFGNQNETKTAKK